MAGATTLGNFAGALGVPAEEATIVAELKAGSEQAYAWLIAQFQQPIYSLVYRIVADPADAADTTQEVFLKVFRGMKRFNGGSSLKTWVYRIAVHEASIEPEETVDGNSGLALKDVLVDGGDSPLENVVQQQIKSRVEKELRQIEEPFRTTVILREIEELSYEEIAEIMQTSLGTVKSRLTRGREALKKRLEPYLRELSPELASSNFRPDRDRLHATGQGIEVTS
jgi:RNA polymerase sigma-70 factor, ECF subfamily